MNGAVLRRRDDHGRTGEGSGHRADVGVHGAAGGAGNGGGAGRVAQEDLADRGVASTPTRGGARSVGYGAFLCESLRG